MSCGFTSTISLKNPAWNAQKPKNKTRRRIGPPLLLALDTLYEIATTSASGDRQTSVKTGSPSEESAAWNRIRYEAMIRFNTLLSLPAITEILSHYRPEKHSRESSYLVTAATDWALAMFDRSIVCDDVRQPEDTKGLLELIIYHDTVMTGRVKNLPMYEHKLKRICQRIKILSI